MQETALPLWFDALAVSFIVGGAVAMWFARRLWKLARASESWPACQGIIVQSKITVSETSNDPSQSITMYTPEVEYEYVVEGQTLRGNRIKFGGVPKSSSLKKAQALAERYPVGGNVSVFYDPGKPTQCTLDQTISFFGVVLLFVMGLIFVVVGAGLFALRSLMAAGN